MGPTEAINEAIKEVQQKFSITRSPGKLQEYIGCSITYMPDNMGFWLTQPDLVKSLNLYDIKVKKQPLTPGTPGKALKRATDEDDTILTIKEQKIYRSLTRKLMYLIKHSRPDIANALCEVSKNMDRENQEHLMELYKAVSFVLGTKDRGLALQPDLKQLWKIYGMSNSSYSDDPDTCMSTSGYGIFFCGTLIRWRS